MRRQDELGVSQHEMHLTIMFFLPFIFLKKVFEKCRYKRYKRYNPYHTRLTAVTLVLRCYTYEGNVRRKMKSEKEKPTENTIGKAGSSLV